MLQRHRLCYKFTFLITRDKSLFSSRFKSSSQRRSTSAWMSAMRCFFARFEEVFETALRAQEVLDREFFLWLIVEDPFAVDDLKEWPEAGVHSQLADFEDVGHLIAPAARAWSQHI